MTKAIRYALIAALAYVAYRVGRGAAAAPTLKQPAPAPSPTLEDFNNVFRRMWGIAK